MLKDSKKKIHSIKRQLRVIKKITTYIYLRTSLILLLHKFFKGMNLIRLTNTYFTLGSLNDR